MFEDLNVNYNLCNFFNIYCKISELENHSYFTGFGGWHMGNQSQDEVFLAAQEAVGAHRDSQGKIFVSIVKTCLFS